MLIIESLVEQNFNLLIVAPALVHRDPGWSVIIPVILHFATYPGELTGLTYRKV